MLKTLIFREFRYNEDIDKSIKELKSKKDIESQKQLASIYHAYKRNDEAIEIFEKLSEEKPNDHEIMAFLGYLYYENDILDLAKACLERALSLSSKEPFVLFLLGNICSRQGRILEACSYYDRSIFLDFDIITAHVDFGRKYEHMGRHEKAYKEYMAAYRLDPTDQDLKEKIDYVKTKI
ncbi:tetratricopeptide repeat protein [Sneathia sanguinegens]|jgi:hypothetical protein|uniref:Tetratricopeptide repeat protein n=1 Tax=Sneathia sanguinegens TaxID=40543 RepID=A0ABT7HJQ8_9FUSO|nr:tetratricopeptide repeat protein [Sneathia sanguinegens]MDK9580762.1 tetratricopeptide repeat protein [Sneathia sanguinegens]MDU4652575.1 tetratricopeptide repeat protein [Sneathia sanguinegens]MDU7497177.1 tetratricopeptide repeat protein [Sneathia sanguinegens]